MNMQAQLPFDRVLVPQPDGQRELSAQDFLDLPLHERIRMIMQRDLRFYAGGDVVDQSDALKGLRNLQNQH